MTTQSDIKKLAEQMAGSMKRRLSLTSATATLKRPSAVTQAILRYPPQETVMVTLNLR